jgi:hypothetical protein
MSATVGEYKEYMKNPELMAGLASIGDDASYITMATRPYATAMNEDGFDSAVYAWQFNRLIEGSDGKYLRAGAGNRSDMKMDVDKEAGWGMWSKALDQLDPLLQTGAIDENAYNSLKSTAAAQIGEKYPGWFEDYKDNDGAKYIKSVNALDTIVLNEEYMKDYAKDPYKQALVDFRAMRDQLVGILVQQKAQGGSSNASAKQNAWIMALYTSAVQQISLSDPTGEFAAMHERFFGNDNLLPIPGRDY